MRELQRREAQHRGRRSSAWRPSGHVVSPHSGMADRPGPHTRRALSDDRIHVVTPSHFIGGISATGRVDRAAITEELRGKPCTWSLQSTIPSDDHERFKPVDDDLDTAGDATDIDVARTRSRVRNRAALSRKPCRRWVTRFRPLALDTRCRRAGGAIDWRGGRRSMLLCCQGAVARLVGHDRDGPLE
jgi:hypothetical protein